jgi:hypothetical protein
MAMGIRVAGNKEGEGDEKRARPQQQGWIATKSAMALAARAMVTRVAPHVLGMSAYVYFLPIVL